MLQIEWKVKSIRGQKISELFWIQRNRRTGMFSDYWSTVKQRKLFELLVCLRGVRSGGIIATIIGGRDIGLRLHPCDTSTEIRHRKLYPW